MLRVEKTQVFGNEYEITEDGLYVSSLSTALYTEATSFNLREKAYRINAKPFSADSFSLEEVDILSGRGPTIAKGTPRSVETEEKRYQLKSGHWLMRWFTVQAKVLENNNDIGVIYQDGFFSSDYIIDISPDVPKVIQVFIFWLVTLFSRREAHG